MIFNFGGTSGGYSAKQMGESGARNLVPFPYYEKSGTESGITWTANDDGTIQVKGTATANVSFTIRATSENWILPQGKYILSGCPSGGSFTTYRLQLARFVDGTLTSYANEYGTGAVVNITDELPLLLQFVVNSGVTIDATVKPMLELGSVAHDFVPYYFGGAENAATLDGHGAEYFAPLSLLVAKKMPVGTDLNDCRELGTYYFDSYATNYVNVPSDTAHNGIMVVRKQSDIRLVQEYVAINTGVMYVRTAGNASTWNEWKTLAATADLANYLPLTGGGTVEYTDFNGFRVKRNVDGTTGLVGIAFQNSTSTVGVVGFKNGKLYRTNVSGTDSSEILDTSNSAKVHIGTSAPSDTSALWVDTSA